MEGSPPDRDGSAETQPRERLALAFFDVGVMEAIARLIAFGGSLYVARTLGSESYGIVAFALAVQLYLTKVADLGVETTASRFIAESGGAIEKVATALTGARLGASLVVILLLGSGYALFSAPPQRNVLLLYLPVLIPLALSPRWILLGMQRSQWVGMARIGGELVAVGLLFWWVRSPADSWVPPIVLLICELTVLAILANALRREHAAWPPIQNGFDIPAAARLVRETLPGVGYALSLLLLYNADIVLIGFFENLEGVGGYAAAYALISFLGNIAVSYGAVLLPVLTRLEPGSAKETETYHGVSLMLLAASLPVALGGAFLSKDIIMAVFGGDYVHAAMPLGVLFFSLIFNVTRKAPAAALIARGHQRALMKTSFAAAAINIVGNLILIPQMGIVGAALATVIAELVLAAATFALAGKLVVATPDWLRGTRPLVASLVMLLGVSTLLANLGDDGRSLTRVLAGASAGALIYGAVMLLLGALRISKGRIRSQL